MNTTEALIILAKNGIADRSTINIINVAKANPIAAANELVALSEGRNAAPYFDIITITKVIADKYSQPTQPIEGAKNANSVAHPKPDISSTTKGPTRRGKFS